MKRSMGIKVRERRLDALLLQMSHMEDPSVAEATARRRCPRCGSYLFRETGRHYCLVCSWERHDGR